MRPELFVKDITVIRIKISSHFRFDESFEFFARSFEFNFRSQCFFRLINLMEFIFVSTFSITFIVKPRWLVFGLHGKLRYMRIGFIKNRIFKVTPHNIRFLTIKSDIPVYII